MSRLVAMRNKPKTVDFGLNQAILWEVDRDIKPNEVLVGIGVPAYNASIAMHSGAGGMTDEYLAKMQVLFDDGLAQFAQDENVMILDGATKAGAMIAIGEARTKINGKFPLVGVTVSEHIAYPSGPTENDDRFPLEANHSHFIIVEADEFGAESDLLVDLIGVWNEPSIAFIVNGGQIVEQEAEMHAQRGTPLLVLKGSGRFADELANSNPHSPLRANYPADAKIEVFDLEQQSTQEFYDLLKCLLVRDKDYYE